MSESEPTVQEIIDDVFQHLEEKDINSLKVLIESKKMNDLTTKHFRKSFESFQSDLTSLKTLGDDEKESRRIYSYAWELILLLSVLNVSEFELKDFSFSHNGREKDLLMSFDSTDYHIEITSKDDITRSREERNKLSSDPAHEAQELNSKNIEDNSIFDYNLENKFDIANVEKVLFIYQMKSGFFHLEDYIKSINEATVAQGFKYILFNNLSSTVGRFVREYPDREVKSWHNFEKKNSFLNNLMNSIIAVLKDLKSKGETHDI